MAIPPDNNDMASSRVWYKNTKQTHTGQDNHRGPYSSGTGRFEFFAFWRWFLVDLFGINPNCALGIRRYSDCVLVNLG